MVRFWLAQTLPHGGALTPTLWINLTGSFVLGFVSYWGTNRGWIERDWYWALTAGVLGGYTTFSTFSVESVHWFQKSDFRSALIYIGGSVIGSIALAFAGVRLAQAILTRG